MIQKNIRLLILGLLLPLLLPACMPQVEREDAGQAYENSAQTAVPDYATSTVTPTAVPQPPIPSPLPRATGVPDHPEAPIPLPTAAVEIETAAAPEDQPSGGPAEDPSLQPSLQAWVDLAKEDLAQRLDLPLDEITLLSFELKEWPDGSLGCPQPGLNYTQVPQEGYLITLQAEDQVYNYHGGGGADPFLCLNLSAHPEDIVTRPVPPNIKAIATKIIPPPRD